MFENPRRGRQAREAREDKNPLLLESVSSRIEPFKYEGGGGGVEYGNHGPIY